METQRSRWPQPKRGAIHAQCQGVAAEAFAATRAWQWVRQHRPAAPQSKNFNADAARRCTQNTRMGTGPRLRRWLDAGNTCLSISNAWATVLEPRGNISVFCVHRLTASALDAFLCCGATVTRRTPSPRVAGNSSHAAVISKVSRDEVGGDGLQHGSYRGRFSFADSLCLCASVVNPACLAGHRQDHAKSSRSGQLRTGGLSSYPTPAPLAAQPIDST
jgi:hypothetical protein